MVEERQICADRGRGWSTDSGLNPEGWAGNAKGSLCRQGWNLLQNFPRRCGQANALNCNKKPASNARRE